MDIRTAWQLRGRLAIELDDMSAPKKQIMVSRSFGRLTGDPADLRGAVRQHTARVGEKLRRQGSLTRAVLVFVRTILFMTDQPQYRSNVVVPLPRPTDDSRAMRAAAQAWQLRHPRRQRSSR
ncbi:hypothetical protein EQG41_06750 [Billgrantia azerbaijanica]|nr:hypothetical protein EQG41_06750 [Halomonas azerbaijanica]